jgi:Ca2+-binding EF-hand superfamily protein
MEGKFNDSGEIKLKTRIDLDRKFFFDDKDNKYRVNKLIKLIDILKKDDFDIELDEMKFTKLKKYKDYPLVKLTKAELKKILANYDIREESYLNFLGIKILENETFSLQLDIFLDKFIRINLKEISFEENLEIIYRIFDRDNNGSISKYETQKLITYFHEINSLVFDENTIKRIAEAVFKHIDKSNLGHITKSAMTKYLEKYKDEDITINPFTRVKTFDAVTKLKKSNSVKYSEEEEKLMSRISRKKDRSKLKKFWFLNKKMIIWSIIYFVLNILSAYINMKLENNRIVKTTLAARFFAGIIFLNMSLVILFMCNYLNTLLSLTKLKFYLPLGDTKQYHIVCASVLGLATIPHVLFHLLGDFPYIAAKCATNPAKKYVTVFWLTFMNLTGITGVIILILFSIIIIVPLIKHIKNKKYELFLNTHKLFYIAIIIMFAHCRTPSTKRWPFVFFMTGPLIFFAIELIVRLIRYIKNESKIIRVKYLKSGVIMLEIQKPKKFNFRCGQYAQLNIPAISKWQWHPFTFASSPNDDNLFFFISPAGDWTSQLKNFSTEDINSNNSLNGK